MDKLMRIQENDLQYKTLSSLSMLSSDLDIDNVKDYKQIVLLWLVLVKTDKGCYSLNIYIYLLELLLLKTFKYNLLIGLKFYSLV